MPGQIDQDINSISADLLGDARIVPTCDFAPMIDVAREPVGHGIAVREVGVRKNLEPGPVVALKNRRDKGGDGMVAKIRRNVADSQLSIRIFIPIARKSDPRDRIHIRFAEANVLVKQHLRGRRWVTMQSEQNIPMGAGERWIETHKFPVLVYGAINAAGVGQHAGELVVRV